MQKVEGAELTVNIFGAKRYWTKSFADGWEAINAGIELGFFTGPADTWISREEARGRKSVPCQALDGYDEEQLARRGFTCKDCTDVNH